MEEMRFEVDCNCQGVHFHEELEVLYVLSGRMAVLFRDRNFVLSSEDLVIFNPYEFHEIYRDIGCHTISAYIPLEITQRAELGYVECCSCLQPEMKEYFQLLRARLAVLFKNYRDEGRIRRSHALSQIFALLDILKQQFEKESKNAGLREGSNQIRQALIYIGENYSKSLSLKDVADQVYLSESHLSRSFQKYTGLNFSEYLRKMRLNQAVYRLCHSEKSVLEIALQCGYSNVNTFILNFKNEYHMTPGNYRKQHKNSEANTPAQMKRISYMGLLKYAYQEEKLQPLDKKQREPTVVSVDIQKGWYRMPMNQCNSIGVGWAKNLLLENVHSAICRAAREIGFRYVLFHGILDDSLDLYHEDAQGNPFFSFTYLDMMLDSVLDAGVKPWFDFGYTPTLLVSKEEERNIFGSSCVNLPCDLQKWERLIEAVCLHLLERYDEDEVNQWRFSPSNTSFLHYGVFSLEAYLKYYECTYRTFRKYLPRAFFCGCEMDIGFLTVDGEEPLVEMLTFFVKHQCMPDAITFQSFQADYSKESRLEIEKRISKGTGIQDEAVAPVSYDPDRLHKEYQFVREILNQNGAEGIPIFFSSWNSTIWQGDPNNDICFKSAYIFRSYLENLSRVQELTYVYLTDTTERFLTNMKTFSGGVGLMTFNGIPKASYYAYQLLNLMNGILVEQGDGYAITRSENGKNIQIGLYNYCHYDPETRMNQAPSVEEQDTWDRYYGLCNLGARSYRIFLKGMEPGNYDRESYFVNRDHGSSCDMWTNMGAPSVINREQKEYMDQMSRPGYRYERLEVDETETAILSAVLDEHEICVIVLSKR